MVGFNGKTSVQIRTKQTVSVFGDRGNDRRGEDKSSRRDKRKKNIEGNQPRRRQRGSNQEKMEKSRPR